jgi:hypothetical protein
MSSLDLRRGSRSNIFSVMLHPDRSNPALQSSNYRLSPEYKQLILTKFIIANGSDAAPINSAIASADSLLSGFAVKLPYNMTRNPPAKQPMLHDASTLALNRRRGGSRLSPPRLAPISRMTPKEKHNKQAQELSTSRNLRVRVHGGISRAMTCSRMDLTHGRMSLYVSTENGADSPASSNTQSTTGRFRGSLAKTGRRWNAS